jgi:hypothetical protein
MRTGTLFHRASFRRRFRIVARKYIYFHRAVYKLGPGYANCPTDCTRRDADMANNCPKCEYQHRWKLFEKECEAEIAKKSPGPAADAEWPMSLVLRYLNEVADADSAYGGKRIKPTWTVLMSQLVRIYRDEIAKARAEDDWNRKEEMAADREYWASRSGNKARRDEDYD